MCATEELGVEGDHDRRQALAGHPLDTHEFIGLIEKTLGRVPRRKRPGVKEANGVN